MLGMVSELFLDQVPQRPHGGHHIFVIQWLTEYVRQVPGNYTNINGNDLRYKNSETTDLQEPGLELGICFSRRIEPLTDIMVYTNHSHHDELIFDYVFF